MSRAKAPPKKHRPEDGRKASSPLYVMVTGDQKERFERAAETRGMSMRELVVNAVEQFIGGAEFDASQEPSTAAVDVPWLMRSMTSLLSRVAQLETDTERNRLRLSERRGQWRHTHNASVHGNLIKLYAETHGPHRLLFERESLHPTWSISMDGALDRLDGGEPGIVVEAG